MRVKSCEIVYQFLYFEAYYLKITKLSDFLASTHKAALTDHFYDHFVCENVARLFDIVVTS